MPDDSITPQEIIELHDNVILRYGGSPGLRIQECLPQVIGNAEMAEQYTGNSDGTLGICFIGSLMYYLNKNQCFVDANKRTSFATALVLLGNLGLTLDVSDVEAEQYAIRIATDQTLKSSDVVRWLAVHAVARLC